MVEINSDKQPNSMNSEASTDDSSTTDPSMKEMSTDQESASSEKANRSLPKFIRILLGIVLLAVVVGALIFLPQIKNQLIQFLDWVRGIGPWGPLYLGMVYVIACVLFIPGSLLTAGAGFAFGPILGTITVSVASVIGASLSFFLGRTLLRDWIAEKVQHNPKFKAIDEAVGQQGFKIVLLTRLSPIFPFNLLNYSFGITKVSFRDYVFASWIGMFPGTVMYVYLGSAVKNLADLATGKLQQGIQQQILFGIGLIATIVVTVIITRIARKALNQAIPLEDETSDATSDDNSDSTESSPSESSTNTEKSHS